ncbi:MAG: hypothetical protein JWQ88_3390, partial [Rhodoferax sp.]|nr:hypothetical protein [Rhodoferax sp.]
MTDLHASSGPALASRRNVLKMLASAPVLPLGT